MTASARRTDPATSRDAARWAEAAGVSGDQRATVRAAVERHPGRTAAELAELVRMERHAPSRRLPELERSGAVRRGEPRPCRVVGRRSVTWWPAAGNPDAAAHPGGPLPPAAPPSPPPPPPATPTERPTFRWGLFE